MDNYEKKYKEALERAMESMKDGGISQNTIDYLQDIFPEISESEDEKIRKHLIETFKIYFKNDGNDAEFDGLLVRDIVAWLEKQSKLTNKD